MPPRAKRYVVCVTDPLLRTVRHITGPLTAKDADFMIGKVSWEAWKKEVLSDELGTE